MMLPRTILLRQRQQLPSLLQLRTVSTKATRLNPSTKSSSTASINIPDSHSSGVSNSNSNSNSSNTPQALLRSRKLTPNAKAKAQASASRALREQLAVAVGRRNGGEADDKVQEAHRATRQQQLELDLQSSSSDSPLSIRKLHDAIAFSTAESYNFEKLISSGRLPRGWQLLEDDEVIYVPQWPQSHSNSNNNANIPLNGVLSSQNSSNQGEAFIFRSGSYVTWGMSGDQSRKFLRMVIQGRPLDGLTAEVDGYDEVGDEAMEYLIAEDQITRVVGDVIVIGQAPRTESDEHFDPDLVEDHDSFRTNDDTATSDSTEWSPLLARLAFSQGLSRSARLSVQEAALSNYLEEVSTLPKRLASEGKVPLHRKEVIRKMGTLLQLRQRANLDSENFLDDPEMYWENWKVEHHYDSICLALDIETRFKAYNEKLDHGENLLGILRALLTESSTHRMELIIIYLIAFEVCIALISHEYVPSPMKVWNLLKGVQTDVAEEEPTQQPLLNTNNDNESEQRIMTSLRRLLLQDARPQSSTTSFSSSSARLV